MAGHSHWHNIKRKKEVEDKKRARIFARLSKMIISAVKEGGKDPDSNPTLRTAISKAKEEDMPKDRIEKAIRRGAGEGEEGSLESFQIEAYGPDKIALIIKGETDNRNRTLNEIASILKKYGGKLAKPGSVEWLFEKEGVIEVPKGQEIEMDAIEAGAEEIIHSKDVSFIYTPLKDLDKVKKELKEKTEIISASPGFRPKDFLNLKKEKYLSLFQELEDSEEVEVVYSNLSL